MDKVETKMLLIGDDGPAAAGTTAAAAADRSFAAFLRTAQAQNACGEDLIARLSPAATSITSLPALLRWSRERHPEMFPPQDWRQPLSTAQAPYGSTRMKVIWSKFLLWRETP
jgi:hypothetical protein